MVKVKTVSFMCCCICICVCICGDGVVVQKNLFVFSNQMATFRMTNLVNGVAVKTEGKREILCKKWKAK